MSKDKPYKDTHKGYSRCEICDFSPMSERGSHSPFSDTVGSSGKHDVEIRYDKQRGMNICSLCKSALETAKKDFTHEDVKQDKRTDYRVEYESQFGKHNPKAQRSAADARREKPKVTLPGVTGVNEGPRVDLGTPTPQKPSPEPTSGHLEPIQDGGDPKDWVWTNEKGEVVD